MIKTSLTVADRAALAQFEALKKSIERSTDVNLYETTSVCATRRERLEKDPEAWYMYYFPHYCTCPPAAFHRRATKRVVQHPEWYEVRAWSRELAKSTRTMLDVLYLSLTGQKKNIIMCSNSLDNAVRLLTPYRAELEANARIMQDYGAQVRAGSWAEDEFITTSGVAYRGIGAGQSPRGTRNGAQRPDVILIDDIDTDTDCLNPDMVEKKWRWIERALLPTRSVSGSTLIIFCGNIIAEDCIIHRAIEYADHADIINIRDSSGHSTWAEKNTEADINRILSKISYISAQGEYFNNPITQGRVFGALTYAPVPPMSTYDALCCYTDPSFRDTKKNDYKATVLVGRKGDKFYVIRAYVEQTSISRMIDWHYDIAEVVGSRSCYYYMEANFMQDTLLKEFYERGARRGTVITIQGDTRKKDNKFTRIESALEPLVRTSRLIFNIDQKDTQGMKTMDDQFSALSPRSRAHDDAPDAVEGAVYILNSKLLTASPIGVMPRDHKNKYRI